MKGGRSHRLQTHYQNDPHEDWVDESWTVDCVCGVNFDDGEEMVNCDDCGVWVHTRCSKYVKGEELFTCDKCKRRKKRGNSSNNDDSDETEVAQLLVELPTKTIRLWTEIPMEERVHVQGIPGGDPALFSGFSKVFTPELWKCTGYVPKKFRVLFSLSKESVFGMPEAKLGGVRERDVGGRCERKVYSREMKKWEGENGEVGGGNFAVRRERSALKPVVANSGKRRKEDLGMSKDWSVKKKARTAEKEMEAKKRVFHAFKSAFTSTSDAKPLEFYEERALKSFKSELQSDKNKNLKDTDIQEQKSNSYIAVENVAEKLKNNLAVVELPLDALSPNISRPDYLTGAGLKEEKSSHEVLVAVESSPKVFNAVASAPEHDDCGRVPVKQEGINILSGNLDDKVEGSTGRDVPAVGDPARASPEVKGIQINSNSDAIHSSAQPNVQVEVDNDNSKVVLNCQSPHGDAKGARISYENISENSKVNDGATLGGLSNDHKVQEVDRNMEAVLCHMDKADELSDETCQHKREMERSEGSMETEQCPPEPKDGTEAAEELSKSGETISSTPALPNHSKMVVCVGKSSSTSSTVMNSKMPASDNIRSPDTLNFSSNTKQPAIPGSNTSIKKDRATNEIATDGERLDLSTKTVKECSKSSMNFPSKLLHPSKISHDSFPKRTNSDSKDSMHYSSPKASLAQNSGDTVGSLQIETASHAQNKATTSGLPLRAEKLNQSNGQSSSKSSHALSMNPSAPINSPAALSDEELALLLHQELNSSPRVPRVPRVRHAGGLPHSASPTATNVLMKRTSSSGAKDNSLASRRKGKDTSKDGFRRNQDPDDEAKKTDKPSSSDQRRQDTGYKANSVSKRGDNGSPTAVHSVKKNVPPASTSTANSGPSSSTEVNDHHLSSRRKSPRNISDEETGTVRPPVHRTLPGLINEIMSKGRRMTYEELCNAVLPHWHNLRKHNGERYAYSTPSQAVLDCLRNRHEWAQLVDRGPKTSSSRKRRKFDPDESEDNDFGKVRTSKGGESKRLESQREEKRRKADMLTDDDSGLLSNSSNETLFSEDVSQDNGAATTLSISFGGCLRILCNFVNGSESATLLSCIWSLIVLATNLQRVVKKIKREIMTMIDSRWFLKWERYVGQGLVDNLDNGKSLESEDLDVERPGPIDNSDIIESGSGNEGDEPELARMLLEGKDYVLVPKKVWEKLVQYKGGPTLPRKMISQGVFNKMQFNVEVYPLRLKLIDSRDDSESTIQISKKASLQELYERVCSVRRVEREKASIWDYYNKQKSSQLSDSNQTLEELHLQMDQEILLELKDDSSPSPSRKDSTGNELAVVALEPPRSPMSIAGGPVMSNGHLSSYSLNLQPGSALNSSSKDMDDGLGAHTSVRRVEKGGLAGLQNMGNTCFMNSALQCLVHTPQLVEYFLQDYSEEINTQNPLGMHGELALAFGDLLRKLWSSGRTAVAPRVFKGKLALFAPQFSGYNQHDSQELLAFLLDGLHEDLNRVKQKPYIEMRDWGGEPDEEIADECWRNHKARNDSIIVDVCQGQYKSTLVCPICSKISITFDPFMYLSLPLPSTVTRSMTVTVFYGDGSGLPMPYTISVLKHGNCRDLSQALGTACCLKGGESLLLAEVFDHKIYRLLENPFEPLVSIKDEDRIVAYRFSGKGAGRKKLEIIHQDKSALELLKGNAGKYFGTPLITYMDDDSPTGADIYSAACKVLSPLKRACSSTMAHSGKENGFLSEANGETSSSYNGECEPRDQSMGDTELEDSSGWELPFQLFLTDDRYSSCKPMFKDSVINFGNHIKVVFEWTEKEQKLYDSSYLKDLPEVYSKTGYTAKKTRQEVVSLFSCLEAFLTEEPLGPDDMYCPSCKEHRQATKKLDLWMLPDVLVFHLKRFSYSRYLKNKLDTFVDFPIHNLDLSKYLKKDGQSYTYELFAISNHYGGLGGGHYTAFAKLIDENRWYSFDDSRVSPVNEADIKTSAAYVLFYKRVMTKSKAELGETSQVQAGS
ncbi:hypothetical protein SADUNF_Sadunf16G0293100 [Salix dunnii]|uniref:Ubiquitinyl hydrolase 1 n=1 Tax=Salix dunnii TaxID=1413687 RepID=A0A835MIF5_9ROSI|nr:hypothetical protein SADUNF_Sadunf16G0293100 [Salix dunnii]